MKTKLCIVNMLDDNIWEPNWLSIIIKTDGIIRDEIWTNLRSNLNERLTNRIKHRVSGEVFDIISNRKNI